MRGLRFFVLCLLLGFGLAAAHPDIYSMGPVQRFEPAAGEEVNSISFANGITIDTRAGEPTLPAGLRLEPAAGQSQYYIVQFTGPFLRQWFRELDRDGIKTFGYLPNYAVMARLTPEQRELVASLPMVRWVGLFQPAYKLQQELLSASGPHKVVILLMPGESSTAVDDAVRAGGGSVNDEMTSSFGTTITVSIDGADIATLARLPEVAWMQEWTQGSVCNDNCQWVTQSGWRSSAPADTSLAARPCWAHGVRGKGVITSQTDTGLNIDHDMFRDPNLSVTPPGIWPEHRKIVAYKLFQGATTGEFTYHGSHVAGTICGNDSVTGGSSYYDGMAKDCRHYFVDIEDGSGNFLVPTDHTPLWDTVYLGRGLPDSVRPIRQHSGSWGWGNTSGTYLIQDASTDAYCWAHKDFMNILAAGNEYYTKRLRNPGIAKNVLTIGADTNGTGSNQIADFSSRGPTQDNRIKPNVTAPGVDLWSAQNTGTNGYSQMSGTSMATPAACGTVALMRCYLLQGYYPSGSAVAGDRITYISSALLRSMAIASADPNVGTYTVPSYDIGWGRIDADSVLYFTGDLRKLIITDDTFGVATGEYKEKRFHVASAIPLRVCLAWTDTAAAPNANPTLVNDLDLTLTAPSGTVYKGNKYTSGQSTANPTGRDSLNTEECARVNAPDTGLWTIRVSAHHVATARKQGFAWTVTGDVSLSVPAREVGATAILAPVDTVDTGAVVAPKAVVRNFGTLPDTFLTRLTIGAGYTDTMTIVLGAGLTDTLTFADWTAHPTGTYAVRCTTELTGDGDPTNDLASDSVVVHHSVGISEDRGLPAVFSLGEVLPNPSTGRTNVHFGVPRSSHVSLNVYSSTGALVTTLCNSSLLPARYSLAWDGKDLRGRKVGTGVYLVRLEAGAFTSTRKVVVQR